MISGKASMLLIDEIGQKHEVLLLKAGEFFGEMSLLSGEPSPTSIVAVEDLEVMMLPISVVNQMIERQPSFAREISQILETRRRTIQSIRKAAQTQFH